MAVGVPGIDMLMTGLQRYTSDNGQDRCCCLHAEEWDKEENNRMALQGTD